MPYNTYSSIPEKVLKTDILSTDGSFKLQNITWFTDSTGTDVTLTSSDFGTSGVGYGVWEPRGAKQEFFTFDASTIANYATTGITISTRGLPWGSDYVTEASSRKFDHAAGTKVLLFTNAPAFYNQFCNKANAETITGAYTFSAKTTHSLGAGMGSAKITDLATPTANTDAATKAYVDGVAVAGAPDANETTKGIVELATGAELAAGTSAGSTGARLVAAGSSCKNSTAGAADANKIPVLDANGVLSQTFLDSARTWGAVQSLTADNCQITTDADSANDAVRRSYLISKLPLWGDGSDGAGTISGNTTLTKDMFYTTLTVNSSKTLTTAGYRIYATTSVTVAGTIDCSGGNGANGKADAGASSAGGTAGGAGSFGGGTAGGDGQEVAGGGGTKNGNNSTAISAAIGGKGGDGGAAGGSAGTAGAATASTASMRSHSVAEVGIQAGSTNYQMAGGSGGGSGGVTGAGGNAGSGGGGGGGGVVWISSPTVTVNAGGAIKANGGNAGTAAATGGAAGGSGGGGGGYVYIRTGTYTNSGTVTASAGTKSNGTGGGANGTDGAAGTVLQLTV